MFVLAEAISFTGPILRMLRFSISNSKRLKDSTFRNVFINRNLIDNQRREEARQLVTHSGDLFSYFSFGNDRFKQKIRQRDKNVLIESASKINGNQS